MLRPAPYDTTRPPAWLLVGLGLVLLAGGTLLGRSTADTPATPATTPPPAPQADETTHPPGPTGQESGMPVGFAPDEAGAVAAATAYTIAFDGPLLFDDRLADAVAVAATDQAHAELEEQFTEVAALLSERLNLEDRSEVVTRPAPAGYRLDEFANADHATVAVWGTALVLAGEAPIPPGWRTTTVELVWAGGDWKLAELTSRPGPEPLHA
ncbi:MAG: hypothetical protein ACLFRD_11845, partial [Nitriliruptoraceae bacterium]